MFVVGTVLYRNLGSFLALQRWGRGARGGGTGPEPGGCQGMRASAGLGEGLGLES